MGYRQIMDGAGLNPSSTAITSTGARIAAVLGDIKIAHTVFALPFALMTAHIAFMESGGYRFNTLIGILICMVAARTAAMSFNRYLDRDIDAANPRTQHRSIPSGRARPVDALVVTIISSVIFIAAAVFLGTLPAILSVPTIVFLLAYSWTKRFTWVTHLWLGAALAIAPTGAWIAIKDSWSWYPVILSLGVLLWVAGFDIIYSLQDLDFDMKNRIFSIPASLGERYSLIFAALFHFFALILFVMFGVVGNIRLNLEYFGSPFWVAIVLTVVILIAEHIIVKPGDQTRIGIAFFTMNGVISILLYLSVLVSFFLNNN